MRYLCAFALTVFVASQGHAADLKSGLQNGEAIGPFYVTKIAGADSDGVDQGDNLCYRCRNGGKPQVMVFTRSTDKKVAALVKTLDKAIRKNDDAQLRAFVNVLGEDKDDANDAAKKLAKSTKAKSVPFVVPNEFENGPEDYGLNAKAAVTILLAVDGEVKANIAVANAKDLDQKTIESGLKKILE